MKVIHTATELAADHKVCLALGVFDGVHLGHQQIIRQTIADALQQDGLPLVVTFDAHPATVVAPDHVPPQIYSRPQKLRAIAALGAAALLEIHFDLAFSRQPGEQFIRGLARDLRQLRSICVGADFVFGHQRQGNVPLLQTLGRELGFSVHGMAALALDGKTVSSTRIRQAIAAGDFDAASQMLGRAYAIAGTVVAGDRLGRQLGFPTANLDVAGRVLPPDGVYAAQVRVGEAQHHAVVNIGRRPTVQNPTPATRVEAHLLDFSDDLYGREIELTLAIRLRAEQKFASLAELQAQIARDIAAAQSFFAGNAG